MQKITYRQAAELLGVQYETIKNAVFYNRLTKCATSSSESMLLREQVELFRNKRISTKKLNLEERRLWEEYKKIAESTELLDLATQPVNNESLSTLIVKEILKGSQNDKEIILQIGMHASEVLRLIANLDNKKIELSYPQMPLAFK